MAQLSRDRVGLTEIRYEKSFVPLPTYESPTFGITGLPAAARATCGSAALASLVASEGGDPASSVPKASVKSIGSEKLTSAVLKMSVSAAGRVVTVRREPERLTETTTATA